MDHIAKLHNNILNGDEEEEKPKPKPKNKKKVIKIKNTTLKIVNT